MGEAGCGGIEEDFPSFSEGLSLRLRSTLTPGTTRTHFPSFSEGLSLRLAERRSFELVGKFPFLFGGTFIEADANSEAQYPQSPISLPFRRDFH